jgi:hypothetical protein
MTKISDALTYGLTVRESATDGSDFTNPAADYRRLFLGEDGLLHVKDSAGAVTSPYTGSVATDAIWDAAGDLAVGSGANTAAALTKGNDDDVLTISASTHVPVWAAPAAGGGALILLEQHTAAASATLDFTTCISATYDEYVIEIVNLIPATNAVNLYMRMGTGAGPTFDTGANYGYASYEWRAGGGALGGAEGGQTSLFLTRNTQTTTANWGLSGTLRLFNPGGALFKEIVGSIFYFLSPYRLRSDFIGSYESTTAVTAFQFFYSAGNIASGTIRVYGLAKS